MGIQNSKIDQNGASARGKRNTFDDMMSKSTAITEDSSTLHSSPSADASSTDAWSNLKSLNQAWRSGSSQSAPTYSRRTTASRRRNQGATSSRPRRLHRSDSDPSPPQGSRTVPVKCPPRKTSSATGHQLAASPQEGEDSQYLMRMYDSRTWEMYRRITESRKPSHVSCPHAPLDQTSKESTSEWENLRHDYTDSSEGEHQMIFLFDFE